MLSFVEYRRPNNLAIASKIALDNNFKIRLILEQAYKARLNKSTSPQKKGVEPDFIRDFFDKDQGFISQTKDGQALALIIDKDQIQALHTAAQETGSDEELEERVSMLVLDNETKLDSGEFNAQLQSLIKKVNPFPLFIQLGLKTTDPIKAKAEIEDCIFKFLDCVYRK